MTYGDSPSSCHIEVTRGEMVGQVSPKLGHTGPIVESILYMNMYVLSMYCSMGSSPNPDPSTQDMCTLPGHGIPSACH